MRFKPLHFKKLCIDLLKKNDCHFFCKYCVKIELKLGQKTIDTRLFHKHNEYGHLSSNVHFFPSPMPKVNKLPKETLSIQEAANLLKVSTKTLRRWEALGKLVPVRTTGGHRRYQTADVLYFKKNKKSFVAPTPVEPTQIVSSYFRVAEEADHSEIVPEIAQEVVEPVQTIHTDTPNRVHHLREEFFKKTPHAPIKIQRENLLKLLDKKQKRVFGFSAMSLVVVLAIFTTMKGNQAILGSRESQLAVAKAASSVLADTSI
jgi:excisionase family DNA binding protein